jgi:hypothetical protein
MVVERGTRSTLAAVTLLASAACGGRTEHDVTLPGPSEDDAATGGAAEDAIAAGEDGGAPHADSGRSPVVSEFPLGAYECSSSFDFAFPVPPASGIALGNGTLTLALNGSVLTATFTGLTFASDATSGALQFLPSTGTTASPAAPNQTFDVACTPDGLTSPPFDTVNVTSGSLTLDGNTLFLGFVGAFASGGASGDLCPGQPLTASIVCTKS